MAEMAMFPLESVLLPGMPLGLQIFEPRYLQLLDDVADAEDGFGVVLITRGSEVGGQDQRAEFGTVAQIVQKSDMGGGRWLVEALATDRFRVVSWRNDDPYPKADVELRPHTLEEGAADVVDLARERFGEFLALVDELGVDTSRLDLTADPIAAVYEMAATVPISTYDRYQILAADNIGDAAATLAEAIIGSNEILRSRLGGP